MQAPGRLLWSSAGSVFSRLHMLPRAKLESEWAWLQIAIDKTAGPLEQEAWDWLYAAVQDFYARKPEAG